MGKRNQKLTHSRIEIRQPTVLGCLFGQVVSSRPWRTVSEITGEKATPVLIMRMMALEAFQPIYFFANTVAVA